MEEQIWDTVIIGSGPAGLTAAIYNIRAGLKTVVVTGAQPGGQLTITTKVYNWPGFAQGIGGVKLMMDMQEQVKNLGGEILLDEVQQIQNSKFKIFKILLKGGRILKARAVIVAVGAKTRWLGLEREKELTGKGVSGCATCDGMFFRDKLVAVVGGGDTAVEDAMFLTKFAKKVYLIHRRDELRAGKAEQKRVIANPKVEIWWDSEVKRIEGEERLERIKVINNKTGKEKMVNIDGLFVAIGANPATEFLKRAVDMEETGHIITGKDDLYPSMTSVEGIFAAGDCVDKVYRQAITAAGVGCKAGMEAERWLERLTK